MSISAHEVGPALAAKLSFTRERMSVTLIDGRVLSVPIDWYPRLKNATARERSNWQLIGGGLGLYWPDVEEDISVDSLLAGRRSMESAKSFGKWLGARKGKTDRSA